MLPLARRTAIVTGGSRGIGRAIAVRLAAEGAHVCFTYRSRLEAAAQTLEQIRQTGGSGESALLDVTDASACESLVERLAAARGAVDFLVNNAGIASDMLAVRMKDEAWNTVIASNLTGAFQMSRAALRPMLKARQGRILMVSSVSGLQGNAGQANYAASKAGLVGLAKSLAREYAPRGILVNVIAPGVIETDMTRGILDRAGESVGEAIPLGRPGRPEEVAAAAAFLLGPDSLYITGQVLAVCGGLTI